MLKTGSPPADEARREPNPPATPPSSSHYASRSSTPSISSLDGTPRYLFALSSPPPSSTAPRPSTSLQDMAIKPLYAPEYYQQDPFSQAASKSLLDQGFHPTVSQTLDTSPSPQDSVTTAPALPSLSSLSRLLNFEKYQNRKCHQAQRQLYHAHTYTARTSRLLHTARSVQRTLAECIRAADKHSFIGLFNSFRDTLTAYSEPLRGQSGEDWSDGSASIGYPSSFLDFLPPELRSVVLDFLSKTRRDGNFVAERLASLTHKELLALFPEKGLSKSNDSIFGASARTDSRSSRHLGLVVDGQTELLSSCGYGSPLETLIHSVRGISAPPLGDDPVATNVWSTVCAKFIVEQRPGSEKVVPSIINAWASSSAWPGKERLELWVLQTLQEGSFLQEQPAKKSFRLHVQGRQETALEDEARLEAFYADAVRSLLELLGDPSGASVIPEGARSICLATYRKLEKQRGHQQAFPNFVIAKWLCSTFLPDAVALPEMYGLASDYYIPEIARQRILREVVSRFQKAVLDVVYSWKHEIYTSPEIARLVHAVATRFRESNDVDFEPKRISNADATTTLAVPSEEIFTVISAADTTTIINALHPIRMADSLNSDRDPSRSGMQSSASSISGFSLFPNADQFEPPQGSIPLADALLSAPYDRAFAKPFETVLHATGSPTMEPFRGGEQLREACAGIEDLLSSDHALGTETWCSLLHKVDSPGFQTVRETLTQTVSSHKPPDEGSISENGRPSGKTSAEYRLCEAAIVRLLGEDDVLDGFLATGFASDESTLLGIQECLVRTFWDRIAVSEETCDFVSSHRWFRDLTSVQALFRQETGPIDLCGILCNLQSRKQLSVDRSVSVLGTCEGWLRPTMDSVAKGLRQLVVFGEDAQRLRDKMWYSADVRTSAVYDQLRSVASALRIMGKPKRPARARLAPPLRHWSASKLSNTSLHLKTEAQILELLSASPDHGGPNKLSDDQSRILSTWMERNSVENLCRGEERLQKLCMEVRNAVEQLTAESSSMWSTTLFARDGTLSSLTSSAGTGYLWPLQGSTNRLDLPTARIDIPSSMDTMSSTSSHPLSTRSSRDYLETRSPTLTNKSSAPFWSPVVTEARSPSSATSVGSSQTQAVRNRKQMGLAQANSASLTERVRQHATSLLLSDVASNLFNNGSETDCAFWTGLGGDLTEKLLQTLIPRLPKEMASATSFIKFDFENAFLELGRRFSATSNPYVKLSYLLDMDGLLAPFVAEDSNNTRPQQPLQNRALAPQLNTRRSTSPTTDVKVEGFKRLFCNKRLRPKAIFRDLQCIAALVPSHLLETTVQGKAFWNAAVAISEIKRAARVMMVETADSIIAYYSHNRGSGRSSSTAQQQRDSATFAVPSRTPPAEDVQRYRMEDAAHLLQITAKEGDAVAQRELATLYLTHPDLVDHIVAPLARPRADVFREQLESRWRDLAPAGGGHDPNNRCHPATMCVAHHWMSLSSKGGDALAKEYLRQREEMDRLP